MEKNGEKNKNQELNNFALLTAARNNDIKTVKKMIKEGINVNFQDNDGWAALHVACSWGYIDVIKLLLDNGADVNVQTDILITPLHIGCNWEYIDIIKLLIENGADVTARDKDGDTPLGDLKGKRPKQYEELMEWLTEECPDKALEYMASENIQCKGVEL